MKKLFLTFSAGLALSLVAQAGLAESMRCDHDLISRGDHQGEVLAACGEPLLATRKTIFRSGIPYRNFRSLYLGNGYYSDLTSRELLYHNRSVVEVPVEVWTYNFGPRYFMREVTFEDGLVKSIKTLGYGH